MSRPQAYRFAPRDRSGWLLGLQGAQCVVLGAGLVTTAMTLRTGVPLQFGLVPLTVAVLAAFARVGPAPIHELAPVALAYGVARLRRHSGDSARRGDLLPLPPWMHGVSLEDVVLPGGGAAGVVLDSGRSATGVLAVGSGPFALLDRADQERLVTLWGDALASLCTERGAVARIAWSEHTGPGSLGGHLESLAGARLPADYREVLADAEALAAGHAVLVALTVEKSRLRGGQRRGDAGLIAATVGDLVRLAERLTAADLHPEPLDSTGVVAAVRRQLGVRTGAVRLSTLAEAAGRSVAACPSWRVAWRSVAVQDTMHASWEVAEWPRLEVGPTWMEPLLLHPMPHRTVVVVLEPVAPSRSRRQVERDSTRLAADEEQRARAGFRIGARQRRASEAVAEREAELVAGYAELAFCGIVTVSGRDHEALEAAGAELEQAAAAAGLELRRLDGRHDLALAATLPLGVGPRRRLLG